MGTRYPVSGAVAAASTLNMYVETPTGTIDGLPGPPPTGNVTFTLAHAPRTPLLSNIAVFWNGLIQTPGVDYTITGVTLTFASPPQVGDEILVVYTALVP